MAKNSVLTLFIGICFMIGFVISLVVILMKQQRVKFIVASLKLAKNCFWGNSYSFLLAVVLSGISIGMIFLIIVFIRFARFQEDAKELVPKWPLMYLITFEMLWTHGFLIAISDFLYQSIAVYWYYSSHRHSLEEYSGFK